MSDNELDAWVTELENNPAEIREVLQQWEHTREENEKLKELVLK